MSRVWLGFSEANYTRGQEGPTHLQSTPPVPDVQSVLRSLDFFCTLLFKCFNSVITFRKRKLCQRHNGPKALSTLTHSTPLVQSRSFNKLCSVWQRATKTNTNYEFRSISFPQPAHQSFQAFFTQVQSLPWLVSHSLTPLVETLN